MGTLVLGFIVPVGIIGTIYALLVNRLLKTINLARPNIKKTNRGYIIIRKAKLRAMHSMILAVVVFTLCWLPGHTYTSWLFTRYSYHQPSQSVPLIFPLYNKMRNDFIINYVMTYFWIQTLVYPRYSRQLSNAINETVHFLFAWLCPGRHRADSAVSVHTDSQTQL